MVWTQIPNRAVDGMYLMRELCLLLIGLKHTLYLAVDRGYTMCSYGVDPYSGLESFHVPV